MNGQRPTRRMARRTLARVVARLQAASTRFDWVVQRRRARAVVLSVQGWPVEAEVHLSATGMAWALIHQGVCWDLPMFVDCQPRRTAQGWFCADPDWLDVQHYPTLDALLFDVLARPLLRYWQAMPACTSVHMHATSGRGIAWVHMAEACGPPFKKSTELARWEVTG